MHIQAQVQTLNFTSSLTWLCRWNKISYMHGYLRGHTCRKAMAVLLGTDLRVFMNCRTLSSCALASAEVLRGPPVNYKAEVFVWEGSLRKIDCMSVIETWSCVFELFKCNFPEGWNLPKARTEDKQAHPFTYAASMHKQARSQTAQLILSKDFRYANQHWKEFEGWLILISFIRACHFSGVPTALLFGSTCESIFLPAALVLPFLAAQGAGKKNW